MSSLSQSMATFKIHQDEENVAPSQKIKETKKFGRPRAVLGVISSNVETDTLNQRKNTKTIIDPSVLKDPVLKIKKNDIKDVKSGKLIQVDEKENAAAKKAPSRLTIKEKPKNALKPVQENVVIYDSPMTIETTPKKESPVKTQVRVEEFYACAVYRDDIYRYLRQLEVHYMPKAYYMKRQPDVTYSMRTILVDWLVEVGEEYKLHNETLFMAVSYLDRFLSTMAVARAKLQLLGTSAMLIAAKYEELFPPQVSEFTYITDNTYTEKQVLRMEHLILNVLSFELSAPTSYSFVSHIASANDLTEKNKHLAMYICELALLEADPYFDYMPSMIASGAILLARHCIGFVDLWPANLARNTGYTVTQLKPILAHLNETHSKSFTSKHIAIKDKYKATKYDAVSEIPHKKFVVRE